jgi:hypothetical protein
MVARQGSNRQQGSIDEQVFGLIHYLQTDSGTELLRKAGMFSPEFWLYEV